jgi:multidrug resistance efflux pump
VLRDEVPVETPPAQRRAEFRERRLPLLVWSAAALACALLLVGRGARFEYLALARTLDYEISAGTTGLLEAVLVDPYDEVQAGDVVAKLDDTELNARLERSHATIRQLDAELLAAKAQLLADHGRVRSQWTDDLRRFQTDEEERRLTALELRATLEAGEIEETRLALDAGRSEPLAQAGLIATAEYDRIRLLHNEVRERNEQNRALLEQYEREYVAAQARRREFESSLPRSVEQEPMLRPLQAAIEVESRQLEEIQARRQALVLRSPVTGQVSQVLCRTGQTVVPGEPILTVTEPAVREIVTYLAEADDRRVLRQGQVLVASLGRPERVAESFVVRLGPGLELMPQRLWRDPAVPAYGRAVVIAPIPALDLQPGELLSVRFED